MVDFLTSKSFSQFSSRFKIFETYLRTLTKNMERQKSNSHKIKRLIKILCRLKAKTNNSTFLPKKECSKKKCGRKGRKKLKSHITFFKLFFYCEYLLLIEARM